LRSLHPLIRRQLLRFFGSENFEQRSWSKFLDIVNEAYHEFDRDRKMLERSLDLTSQELLQANEETRSLLRTLPDLFFRVDKDGRILECSGGNSEDFFISPEELVGKRIDALPSQTVSRRFEEGMRRAREEGSVVTIEYSLLTEAGESDYEARITPWRSDELVMVVRRLRRLVRDESPPIVKQPASSATTG